MNLSKILLVTINIFIGFMLLLLTISVGLFTAFFISDGTSMFYFITEDGAEFFNSVSAARMLFHSVSYIFFFTIIFYLRKSIQHIVKSNFFNWEVARNLNITGVLLLIVSLSTIVINFLQELFDGMLNLGIDPFNLNSELFLSIIGLFFMLMSRAINEGIKLKSENDLTI